MALQRLRLFSSAAATAAILLASIDGYGFENKYNLFIPFVPTPNHIVDRMLELAEIGKDDLVLDMGSGDGRIVIAAAQRYGARARGVEIDPKLVEQATQNAKNAGVGDRAEFIAQDMFITKISDATVMTLYVLTASNLELRPRILKEMKPGSRIVSHQFGMGAWIADLHENHKSVDIYYWVVPASVAGTWRVQEGRFTHTLVIEQNFQEITGTMTIGDRVLPLRQPKLRGDEIDFFVDSGHEAPVHYRGRIRDDVIMPRGATGDTTRKWRAARVTPYVSIAK